MEMDLFTLVKIIMWETSKKRNYILVEQSFMFPSRPLVFPTAAAATGAAAGAIEATASAATGDAATADARTCQ